MGAALLALARARWALGACGVAVIDLHSSQTMSAASLSFAFITSNIIGCVLLQEGHQTRGNSCLGMWEIAALQNLESTYVS
jgi:hypothetical protein